MIREELFMFSPNSCDQRRPVYLFSPTAVIRGVMQAAEALVQHFAQARDPFEKVMSSFSAAGFLFLLHPEKKVVTDWALSDSHLYLSDSYLCLSPFLSDSYPSISVSMFVLSCG